MKKGILFSVLAAVLLAAPVKAQETIALGGVSGNVSSLPFAVGPATRVIIHIQSESNSVCTVSINQRISSYAAHPALGYMTVGSAANPDVRGEVWGGPGGGFLQISITGYQSGVIWVTVEAWNGMNRIL